MVEIDYSVVTSWAVVIVISGVAYLYYTKKPTGRSRGRSLLRSNVTPTTRADPVKWDDSESVPKASKSSKPKPSRKPIKKAVQEAGDKAEAYLSAASTAGADADDDLSPVVSPSLGATTSTKAPSGKDVSDMLADGAPTPSVLRINASDRPVQQKKPQQQRPDTPQETKKQRQNRRKAEEAKVQREAEEKQRKILEEKQRRTAREARGEPAKNGLQSVRAPASNAWSAGRPAGAVAATATTGQLLDTFDPEVVSTASSSEAGATNGTAPTPDSLGNSANWTNSLSEQEQLRMALEDSAWETVPKGKKQRKAKPADESAEDTPSTPAPKEVAPVKKPIAKQVENKPPRSGYDVLSEPITNASHPDDSDWPVV